MPIKRDEEAIERWRDEVWPELRRRAQRKRRTLVFEYESGSYLLLGMVRTYAPEGLTPVLREKQSRNHLSVVGGMTPEGKVYTPVRRESINGLLSGVHRGVRSGIEPVGHPDLAHLPP